MTYTASIEWLCSHAGVIRVHPGPGPIAYGAPYVWACSVQRHGVTARLAGAVGAPPLGGARAIVETLHVAGFLFRRYERWGVRRRVVLTPMTRDGCRV